MTYNTRPRLQLRNFQFSQKLLVFVILLSVGGGYIAALANLFAASAPADGKQSVKLAEFVDVYRQGGATGLLHEIEESMGMEDVVKRYYGTGAGVTRMETVLLEGVMRPILIEEFDEESADMMGKEIAEWSRLPDPLRKAAYEEGAPMNDDGVMEFGKLSEIYTTEGKRKDPTAELELTPVSSSFEDNCLYCHAPDTDDARAKKIPLVTYDQIKVYCSEDRGIPAEQLALTTHVHLLGFSVLFALTGFLFSLTTFPALIRVIFVPWTLFFQVLEIACWWMAKTDVFFAKCIFWLGPVIGVGLAIQILGTLLDLIFRRPQLPYEDSGMRR